MRKEKERKGKERKLNRWGWDMILNMKKAEVSIEYCFVSLDFFLQVGQRKDRKRNCKISGAQRRQSRSTAVVGGGEVAIAIFTAILITVNRSWQQNDRQDISCRRRRSRRRRRRRRSRRSGI